MLLVKLPNSTWGSVVIVVTGCKLCLQNTSTCEFHVAGLAVYRK